jgi:hypothetical protein
MKDKKVMITDAEESHMLQSSQPTEIALASQEIDIFEDANAGFEEADTTSFALPFITLLQGLSPQLKDIEGAKPGLFLNTITKELFTEIEVIPCHFKRVFIRWGSRASGGGFKGQFSAIDVALKKIDYQVGADGYYLMGDDPLVDTRVHFVLYRSKDDSWKPALISMKGTHVKKSRQWMTLIGGIEIKTPEGKPVRPASFLHTYLLKCIEVRNGKGEWNSFDISLKDRLTDVNLFKKAKTFHLSAKSGEVEMSTPVDDFQEQTQNSETF